MLLNEILNKRIPYEVIRETDSVFRTRAKIGDRVITFEAVGDDEGIWNIEFSENFKNGVLGKRSYGATNSGNELEVFSMIKDSIIELVDRYQPQTMYFTAEKVENGKDTSRSQLYSKLLNRFKIPGYSFKANKIADGNHVEFIISRDK